MNKKGIGIGDVGAVIFTMAIVVFGIVVMAIMLGALADSSVTNTANCNSTSKSACGYDYNVTVRGLTFLDNATSKFSTAGTILGVLVLLGLVGLAGYGGFRGYQKIKG